MRAGLTGPNERLARSAAALLMAFLGYGVGAIVFLELLCPS